MYFNENLYHYFLLKNSKTIINRFFKNNLKKNIIYNNFDLSNSFKNYVYYVLLNSKSIQKIFLDFSIKKLKKKYIVDSKLEKFLVLELLTLLKIKKRVKIKNKLNLYFNIKVFLKYFFIWFFFKLFLIKNKFDSKILCVTKHKKFDFFFLKILNFTKKKSFLNDKNCLNKIKVNNILFRPNKNFSFNFNVVFFDIFIIYSNIIFYKNILDNSKIKLVLFAVGDGTIYHLINTILKNNSKTICLQWGIDPYKFPKMPFYNLKFNKMIVWGKNYQKIFKKNNRDLEVINIGHLNLERKSFVKNKILLCLPQKSTIASEYLYKNLIQLAEWINTKFKNKLIIRPHPQDNFYQKYKNNFYTKNISINKTHELSSLLSKCKIVISVPSSILVEAARIGIIPFMISSNNKKIYWSKSISNLTKIIDYTFLHSDFSKLKTEIKSIYYDVNKYMKIKKKLPLLVKGDIGSLSNKAKIKFKQIILKELKNGKL
jgi:hypothetical protein